MSVEEPQVLSGAGPNLTDDPYSAVLSLPSAASPLGYRLRFALHAAVLAPSVHNTQPWGFRAHEGPDPFVDLLMDPVRELPALDPAHRQLIMSCGVALAAYEIGLRASGLEPSVELLPPGADPACIARVRVTELGTVDPVPADLIRALVHRRSYRGAMTGQPVNDEVQQQLVGAAGGHALLDFVAKAAWRGVEHLIVEAALAESESPEVDTEIKLWTRLTERAQDGVPAANWLRTSEETAGAPLVQRDFAQGRPVPEHVSAGVRPIEGDPLLAVLFTPADTTTDWIEAGRALLRVSLAAEQAGLALGYLNQPTEVPGLRDELARELQPLPTGFSVPQLLIRLGYAAERTPPRTPRRPVASVLLSS